MWDSIAVGIITGLVVAWRMAGDREAALEENELWRQANRELSDELRKVKVERDRLRMGRIERVDRASNVLRCRN